MCNLVDGSCLPNAPLPPVIPPEPVQVLRSVAEVVALYAGAAIERLLAGIPIPGL